MQSTIRSNRSVHRIGLELTVAIAAFTIADRAAAQGCVGVRGGCPLFISDGALPADADMAANDWLASAGYRYLHSSRHFVGDQEQYQRQAGGNQVINTQSFIDFGVQYSITPRWSVGVSLPVEFSERSSLVGLKGNQFRYSTHASGIGDMQLPVYMWIWDPAKQPKGNIQLGLALKLPTGEDNASDTFLRNNPAGTAIIPQVHPVDQSIQPGDGGWGFVTSVNAYRQLFPRTVGYLQALYLFNPQNVNGVPTYRDRDINGNITAKPNSPSYYESVMSIPDQYFARGGLSYTIVPSWGLSFSFGPRIEGIPPRDLIGKSEGFRRPGFIVSAEPGFELMKGRWTANISLPWAIIRNRQTSVADQAASVAGGIPQHGDAAFADKVLVASIGLRF